MQAAITEARGAVTEGEVPVGAVVSIDGEIIARAHNRVITSHDPSGHAEILALREAGAVRENYRLPGTTLYVTLEPCAMCMGAIIHARVARLVFGAYDSKAGAAGSVIDLVDSPASNHRFEVNGGVLADDCGSLLRDFFRSRR